ncbi:uncharacterized protein DUF58 [Chitinophaga skermanii]|uniref:Uncharacterized protein DUF58 n=1 Tax=Chitinophaga skermanii TaxID=331697 RepID=A0A327QGI6_9BACT|nr:DUF58 domain-containing protein [Chitinophaga skermanii]RAJ02433.1 uncharacterized protein DUF58 [Chitinophaga skermanii]
MSSQKQHNEAYPTGVTISLKELMRYEYYVQDMPILPQHPVYSLLAGRHASKLRGRGLDFEEVRVYVPGDDVRNIDWRVTARTGITHSKVFNEEKERPGFIIVDQTSFLFFGSKMYTKSVIAAQAAALSAFYIVKRGDRVGGIVFNDATHQYISPKRSKSHVQYVLQAIADMNTLLPQRKAITSNILPLNEILQQARSVITHDYVITVISDFSTINQDTKKHLRNLSQHNDVMLVHISDPFDGALPNGRIVLSNGKRQITWQNNKHHWGEKYEEAYSKLLRGLSDEFRMYHIPVVQMDTTLPVEQQVMQHMGKLTKR